MTLFSLRTASAVLLLVALAACSDDDGPAQLAAAPAAPAVAGPAAPAPAAPVVTGGGAVTGGELEVEDQRGDGRQVRVQYARVAAGSGHVVVQSRDGAVAGSAPVPAAGGPVVVPLTSAVTGSGELLAVLHTDDGDGRFDPARDTPVLDDEGEREVEEFDYRV